MALQKEFSGYFCWYITKLLLCRWRVLLSTGSLQKCRQVPSLLSLQEKNNLCLWSTAKASVKNSLDLRIHSNGKRWHRSITCRWAPRELEMHLRKCSSPERQHSREGAPDFLHAFCIKSFAGRLKQSERRRQISASNILCCARDLRLSKYFQSKI